MLTVTNVSTNAIDDMDIAVEEITSQLKGKQFLKNSVGIIACHADYIENGTIESLHNALAIDIIGCSVLGSAVNGRGGMEQLSLTILSSDDVTFATAFSDTITKENPEEPIEKVFVEAKNTLGCEPSLVFVLGPIMAEVLGDQMLKKLEKLSHNIPIFGTMSNDTTLQYTNSYVFKNNESHHHKMALLLLQGNINPRFYTTSIAERNIQQQNAVVTEAAGYWVTKINHLSILDYFTSIGIQPSALAAVTMIPFLVDFGDGTEPVAYSMYEISEKGAHCGGEIPVGAKITFAEVDYNSVMETAEMTLQTALADVKKNGANGIIAIPCFSRALVLSPNVESEIEKSIEIVGDEIPFSLIYSGGEICPIYDQQRKIVNRFHNLTYTLMVF
jgi:hypothetical protein